MAEEVILKNLFKFAFFAALAVCCLGCVVDQYGRPVVVTSYPAVVYVPPPVYYVPAPVPVYYYGRGYHGGGHHHH
jgi:hypothetical protein